MPSSFITYIDESGCDGFRFGQGSSDWLVLAAAVFRKQREPDDVKVIDRVRAELGKQPKHDLHFRELRHEHRVLYTDRLGGSLIRCCAVLVDKPSISEPATFHAKNRLYHYVCRYLMERVSWILASHRLAADPGDGATDIVFSHRRTTPHSEIVAYLERLKTKDTEIDWSAPTLVGCAHYRTD